MSDPKARRRLRLILDVGPVLPELDAVDLGEGTTDGE